jgi:hypothetical protein
MSRTLVLHAPSSTIMPRTFHVLRIAVGSGFQLDTALPQAQLEKGNHVAWDAAFIDDVRSGLKAVKVW